MERGATQRRLAARQHERQSTPEPEFQLSGRQVAQGCGAWWNWLITCARRSKTFVSTRMLIRGRGRRFMPGESARMGLCAAYRSLHLACFESLVARLVVVAVRQSYLMLPPIGHERFPNITIPLL
jgi:hypothetical protein